MDDFLKAAAGILLTVILVLAIGKGERDLSSLLTMIVCCMVGILAVSYFEPVLDLLQEIAEIGALESELLDTLLKAVGITLVTEVVRMVCADSGNSSLGKSLQILCSAAILYLSLPIISAFFTIIRDILGEL